MFLTIGEVARLFRVSENVVYRWVNDEGLPAEQLNGRYQFNRSELLEWATLRKAEVNPGIFEETDPAPLRLDLALRQGGILHGVRGSDREAVFRAVLDHLPLPPECDREFLLQMLLSRETCGSTGIGNGLAIPHPRYPIVLPVEQPAIALAFLEQPIPFQAADAQPVHTLFVMICPTVRLHLQLLARLAVALRDPEFSELVRRKAGAEPILAQAQRLEETRFQAQVVPTEEE